MWANRSRSRIRKRPHPERAPACKLWRPATAVKLIYGHSHHPSRRVHLRALRRQSGGGLRAPGAARRKVDAERRPGDEPGGDRLSRSAPGRLQLALVHAGRRGGSVRARHAGQRARAVGGRPPASRARRRGSIRAAAGCPPCSAGTGSRWISRPLEDAPEPAPLELADGLGAQPEICGPQQVRLHRRAGIGRGAARPPARFRTAAAPGGPRRNRDRRGVPRATTILYRASSPRRPGSTKIR